MAQTAVQAFDEGRVAAAALAGTNTLQCSSANWPRNWPVNLLAGAKYIVACHGQIRLISTNTADTLTISGVWTTGIAAGETFTVSPLASGPDQGTAGLSYYGVVTAVPGANQFTIPTLAGLGAGKFVLGATQYSAYVLRDAGGVGALPQGETRLVTVYATATGIFTTTAFAAAVAVGDEILLLHPVLGGGGGGAGMPATAGLWMFGIVSPVQVASTTVVDIPHLAGFQNDTFNGEFYMEMLNAGGAAPEGQKRVIADYVGATGRFTTDAFTATVDAGDIVAIFHKAIEAIDIIARGTLDTSSDTVPADSTRTEGNNHFRGHLLIPTEGTYAGRATRIVEYTGVGGIFIVDPNNPFPGATGLVDYIVAKSQAEFVPAGGGTNNRTPADVVGMKDEVIPAMNVAPATVMTDTVIHHLKAILERVGATPADPDDSLLTNVGQRDDAATLDDLSDVTTTSIEAKLRRILLKVALLAAGGAGELTPARAALLSNLDAAITTRAAPGAQMALTAAERLIVQALIINDLTPFSGADIAELAAGNIPLDIDGLKSSRDRQLFSMDFWSDPQEEVAIPAIAATLALPTVTVADLPAGAVIVRAIAMVKFRMIENINAGANKLDGATVAATSQVIRVQDDTPGIWRDAINFVDDQFGLAASTREGGDVLIGSVDIAIEVDGNDGYNFQYLLAKADLLGINWNDVQCGLRVWYSV